jgi:hypothetical protein
VVLIGYPGFFPESAKRARNQKWCLYELGDVLYFQIRLKCSFTLILASYVMSKWSIQSTRRFLYMRRRAGAEWLEMEPLDSKPRVVFISPLGSESVLGNVEESDGTTLWKLRGAPRRVRARWGQVGVQTTRTGLTTLDAHCHTDRGPKSHQNSYYTRQEHRTLQHNTTSLRINPRSIQGRDRRSTRYSRTKELKPFDSSARRLRPLPPEGKTKAPVTRSGQAPSPFFFRSAGVAVGDDGVSDRVERCGREMMGIQRSLS